MEYLDLRTWHVSDDGIAKLGELKNLKTIWIDGDQGDWRNKLQGLLPGVKIE
jgi:hypothetical protein